MAVAGLVLAGVAAYANSFAGVLLFDDRFNILGGRRLTALWPLWTALKRRRFLVDYSFAVNYEIGGPSPWGFHLVNLVVHLLAGLTLFGVVRRAAGLVNRVDFRNPLPTWFAFTVALFWLVHPLQTQSVTYLVQRAESLMGLFYLLTLYCVIRGATPGFGPGESSAAEPDSRWSSAGWLVAAVIACAAGMSSKGIMITAPLTVLAFDRLFLARSWATLFRRRWGLYVALFATCGILWATGVAGSALNPANKRATVGFGYDGATPGQYLLTQTEVILHYLRLVVWPYPLCLDHDWPFVRGLGEVWPAGLVVIGLLAGTGWALCKRPWLGFAGLWFFLILTPTSSFVPIKDPIFEHRMYLPLAGALTVLVAIGYGIVRRAESAFARRGSSRAIVVALPVVGVATLLAVATVRRNAVYHSEVRVWQDVLSTYPQSPRATENHATAMLAEGRLSEARDALERAAEKLPNVARIQNALGFALAAHGQREEAKERFERAIELDPTFARAHLNLGIALNDLGQRDQAMDHFQEAVRLSPGYTDARLNLGNSFMERGEVEAAVEQYQLIVAIDPNHASAWGNLGTALFGLAKQNAAENAKSLDDMDVEPALQAWRVALELDPESTTVFNSMGIALADIGRWDEAVHSFRQALRLSPGMVRVHLNLALCLEQKGDWEGAAAQYLAAYKLSPDNADVAYDYGYALLKSGKPEGALAAFEQALRLKPDHGPARKMLKNLQNRPGGGP
jgi:tetratricopeptide (TPR) repeat protein